MARKIMRKLFFALLSFCVVIGCIFPVATYADDTEIVSQIKDTSEEVEVESGMIANEEVETDTALGEDIDEEVYEKILDDLDNTDSYEVESTLASEIVDDGTRAGEETDGSDEDIVINKNSDEIIVADVDEPFSNETAVDIGEYEETASTFNEHEGKNKSTIEKDVTSDNISAKNLSAAKPVSAYGQGVRIEYELNALDGRTITDSTFGDDITVLVFYRALLDSSGNAICMNSSNLLTSLQEATQKDWIRNNNVKFILVPSDGRETVEDVRNFSNTYGGALPSDSVIFTEPDNSLMWEVNFNTGGGGSLMFAYLALVKNGEILDTAQGAYQEGDIYDLLEQIIDRRDSYQNLQIFSQFDYDDAYATLDLVNKARAENGLSPVTMDADLLDAAMQRASELGVYYSHTRPSEKSCFTVSDKANRENIAAGYLSAESVMDGWMNSQGHRTNILGSGNTSAGIGAVTIGGRRYWCQLFGSGAPASVSPSSYPNSSEMTVPVIISQDYIDDGTISIDHNSLDQYSILDPGSELSLDIKYNKATLVPGSLTYTSSNQNVIKISDDGTLKANWPGKAVITVRAMASASGAPNITSFEVTVNKWNLTNAAIGAIANVTYTGKEVKPTPVVSYGNRTLQQGTDYTISYRENANAGTASVIITGKGDYESTTEKTFKILPVTVTIPTARTGLMFTGNTQTGVAEGTEYTVKNGSATAAGKYTAAVNLKDTRNYTWSDGTRGVKNLNWEIKAKNISGATVTGLSDKVYTGKAITQNFVLNIGNTALKSDTDYITTYKNNTNVGISTVTVTGKGNYNGTIEKNFNIMPAKIAIPVAKANLTYTGKNQTGVAEGTEYTVKNGSATVAGKYTAAVNLKDTRNYTWSDGTRGVKNLNWEIKAKSISGATVTGLSDKVYTGKAITQNFVLKIGNTALKSDTDYTVTYKNNVNTGTAIVTITGKGNYTGTLEKTFKITPLRVAVTRLKITPAKAELATEKTLQMKFEVTPSNATNKTVSWKSSNPSVAKVDANGKVTAIKYGKTVTITATSKDNGKVVAKTTIQTRFYDVNDTSKYYYKPVYWAADKGITSGYDNVYFGPKKDCTRQEMTIFLWRLSGKPSAKGSLSFSDTKNLKKTSTAYKAILWASEKGIVKGYSSGKDKGKFKPDAPVTRKDTLIMLYRLAKKPKVSGKIKFPDVVKQKYNTNSDTYKAILWGTKQGITNGYSNGNFKPFDNCLREHIVTFIYRYDQKIKK